MNNYYVRNWFILCDTAIIMSPLSQAEWELQTKFIREVLPLSQKVQKGPFCFLNSFSEKSLDPILAPDFLSSLSLKSYRSVRSICITLSFGIKDRKPDIFLQKLVI